MHMVFGSRQRSLDYFECFKPATYYIENIYLGVERLLETYDLFGNFKASRDFYNEKTAHKKADLYLLIFQRSKLGCFNMLVLFWSNKFKHVCLINTVFMLRSK